MPHTTSPLDQDQNQERNETLPGADDAPGFPSPACDPEAEADKSRAALSSVLWSGFLTLMKLAAGLSSNSLGMLSEALHSALDLVAAAITYLAVRLASRPADTHHPFGHGKVEHLSALAETALLVLTCAWIVDEAVRRLFFDARVVEPRWWVFGVALVSLIVDVNRSAMLRRAAKRHRSQALEADALHFTSDVWSTSVVLAGLVCVVAGNQLPPESPWRNALLRADAVAALGVACMVLAVSWRLARRAVFALMDGGCEAEAAAVAAALADGAPAFKVLRVRVRESGSHFLADVDVETPPSLRMDDARDITAMLEDLIRKALPEAEARVRLLAAHPSSGGGDMYAAARRVAAMHGLPLHNLALVTLDDGLHVFAHIELDPDMPLAEAHARVSACERELALRLGAVHVVTHIEPSHHGLAPGDGAEPERAESGEPGVSQQEILHAALNSRLPGALAENPGLDACYDEEIWDMGNRLALSLRCRSGAATVAEAHKLAAGLEESLRRRMPGLGWVTIHMEPHVGQVG